MLLFIADFGIILPGGFLLKKLYSAQRFFKKCFYYQLIANSQAYQSLGAKKMQIVLKISLTEAFLAIR